MFKKGFLTLFYFLTIFLTAATVYADDKTGWNNSRRYMAKGICESNYKDMCSGKGVCDTGGVVSKCNTGCGQIPGGWYTFSYYCSPPPANVCTGNTVTKNYNYPDQSCDVYCTGWGVHYCFILDGTFKQCTYGNDPGYCMCGEIIGTTPGCTPVPPDGGENVKQ